MLEETIYEDKDVLINKKQIKIKCYYFPTTQSKTIPFSKIKNIQFGGLDLMSGKGRIWGMSIGKMGYWFAGDLKRMQRQHYIAIHTGSKITPTFTTEKDHYVYKLLFRLWKESQGQKNDQSLKQSSMKLE